MSLLENMRSATQSGAMKVVLAIIVLVFVFWGIGRRNGPQTQVVAEVNGKRITDTQYHREMRQAAHRAGHTLSDEETKALARRVVNRLILQEVLDQEAHRLGLEISDEEIARQILEIEVFQDENGRFSQELYGRYLKRMGTRKGAFEEDLRRGMLRQKLLDLAVRGIDVSTEEVREYWTLSHTRLTIAFARVTSLTFYDDIQPGPDELARFEKEHAAEISGWYQQHFEQLYHEPPRARLRRILLRSDVGSSTEHDLRLRMAEIREQIDQGADFAEMARRWSEGPHAAEGGELGLLAPAQMDEALARVVFGDEDHPNTSTGLRPPILTTEGIELALVEEMVPEKTTPESEVRDEIAANLIRQRQAPELASAFAEKLLQAWKSGDPSPVLAEQSLQLLHAGPFTLSDPSVPELSDVKGLRNALVDAREGEVLDRVLTGPDTWVVVRVESREEPDPSGFEPEREKVHAQLKAFERMRFVQAYQDDLLRRARIKRYLQL